MGRLEYDDVGFAFFGIGLGTSILVPLTLFFLQGIVNELLGTKSETGNVKPRTEIERKHLKELEDAKREKKNFFDKAFKIKAALIVLGWIFVAFLYTSTATGAEVLRFEPWEILGLEEGATEKKIKSAYRKLSLIYHPDRNVNKPPDERAEKAMIFDRIQKAHEILTNPETRDLFERTGSTDGSTNMEVSIGLPKFLLQKENHNLVLLMYLLILCVALPVVVANYYSNSKLYGDRLILNDSYNIYTFLLKKGLSLDHFPEVLALSAEFRNLPDREQADETCILALRGTMREEGLMPKEYCAGVKNQKFMQRWSKCQRANVLIYAFLNRKVEDLTPGLKEDLQFVLNKSNILIEAMNEAVQYSRNLKLIRDVLTFESYFTQALWTSSSPLLQLPYLTPDDIKRCRVGKKSTRTIDAFVQSEARDRDMVLPHMAPEDRKEVDATCELLPNTELTIKIGVIANEESDGSIEFEEKACEGDVITAQFELKRKHKLGPVYSPSLPFFKTETWYVLFCKEGEQMVLSQSKLEGHGEVLRAKTQFPSKGFIKPGISKFDFYLVSNSYVGFDLKLTESLRLYEEGTVKPIELHQEDLDLDNEMTLFEEAFGKAVVSDDSDFADSEDEAEPQSKEPPIAKKKSSGSTGSGKNNKGNKDLVADESDDDFE